LGVVQSRVADIERNPGAVSVEQLLQVLAMLGAHIVVREATTASSIEPGHAQANATTTATLTARPQSSVQQPGAPQPGLPDDEPRGQW
jgi:HTH-type transcriptional regulator/antitoxin HipB